MGNHTAITQERIPAQRYGAGYVCTYPQVGENASSTYGQINSHLTVTSFSLSSYFCHEAIAVASPAYGHRNAYRGAVCTIHPRMIGNRIRKGERRLCRHVLLDHAPIEGLP